MKQGFIKLLRLVPILILFSCITKPKEVKIVDPTKFLPDGELTKKGWFISPRTLHDNYGAFIYFEFHGTDLEGEIYFYEDRSNEFRRLGLNAKTCDNRGTYKFNVEKGILQIILPEKNPDPIGCPWRFKINGTFTYVYLENRYYSFTNGSLNIIKVPPEKNLKEEYAN